MTSQLHKLQKKHLSNLETMESSSVLETILVLNALINTKKLQIEAQPAAVLGVDENHQVPALVGEHAELAIQDAA